MRYKANCAKMQEQLCQNARKSIRNCAKMQEQLCQNARKKHLELCQNANIFDGVK